MRAYPLTSGKPFFHTVWPESRRTTKRCKTIKRAKKEKGERMPASHDLDAKRRKDSGIPQNIYIRIQIHWRVDDTKEEARQRRVYDVYVHIRERNAGSHRLRRKDQIPFYGGGSPPLSAIFILSLYLFTLISFLAPFYGSVCAFLVMAPFSSS